MGEIAQVGVSSSEKGLYRGTTSVVKGVDWREILQKSMSKIGSYLHHCIITFLNT